VAGESYKKINKQSPSRKIPEGLFSFYNKTIKGAIT
jgi:hypothetical protein